MGDNHQYYYHHLPVLRHIVAAGSANFEGNPQAATEPLIFAQSSRNLSLQTPHHHFNSIMSTTSSSGHEVMLPSKLALFDHYCTNATTTSSTSGGGGGGGAFYGVDMETGGWMGNEGAAGGNNNSNNSRWPRQETLTLLEIRSRLDSRFKEANQKGPLWDEISRIMAEEHGYQRSGKKCREKFENLYKYYKKTREGKAGRQDGKHYRFFRQLEALYGDTSNNNSTNNQTSGVDLETHIVSNINHRPLHHHYQAGPTMSNTINQENFEAIQENKHSTCTDQSLSFSNASEFETSSSENNDDDLTVIAHMMNRSVMEKQKGIMSGQEGQSYGRGNKKGWKAKVKDFVDSQMRKVVETQEAWMDRMLKTIEDREHERLCREEEWKKKEAARFDQEHEFWAKERAWIEARDAALMETLKKYTAGNKKGELSSIVEQITKKNEERNIKNNNPLNDEINTTRWTEAEILSLIQLKTTMEQRFQEIGYPKQGIWEVIAAKMADLGYDRSVEECQEKWENMNFYFNMTTTECCNKKRKEDLRTSNYFQQIDQSYNSSTGHDEHDHEIIAKPRPESNSHNSNVAAHHHHQMQGGCFQYFPINDDHQGEQLWNKYGYLKLSNENNNQL